MSVASLCRTAVQRRRAHVIAFLPALVMLLAASCGAVAAVPPDGPTVREVVEFTRIVQPRNSDQDQLLTQVSPDGTQLFIVTRKADTSTDRNRYRILLLDLQPQRLASGRAAGPVAVVSFDATDDNDSANPALQDARWAGDRTIVFRSRVRGTAFQVHKVDVKTRRVTQLSHAPRGVLSFALSRDLRRLVYTAPHPNPPLRAGERSVVVGNKSFWSVKFGQHDMRSQQRMYQYFVSDSGSRQEARPLGDPFAEAGAFVPAVSISPDGRWALVPRYEPGRQLEWGSRYPHVAAATARAGPSASMDPLGYFSRPVGYLPRRLLAYRLADGHAQAVVDAPDDSVAGLSQVRPDRLWQGSGLSVVIAGTHLPPDAVAAEQLGASHLIEYWPDSGHWKRIATLAGRLVAAQPVQGRDDSFTAVDGTQRRTFQRDALGEWHELGGGQHGATAAPAPAAAWTPRIEEDPNLPPDVVATGPDGQKARLTQLNPQYSERWGTVRPYGWKDAKGRAWDGGLLVPAGFDPTRRYELVIQTYGFSPKRFYLDGANQFDGYTSGFAGRAFLRQDMLVLAFPWRASTDAPSGDRQAVEAFMDGVRAAIDALVAQGWVHRDRVGIMGWSATGERVLNQVTFADTPIRAASLLDGDANTLFSMAVSYAASDNILARKERTNGGPPFGDALEHWVRNDPALHTDCVKAALRIETYGPWVLNNWDIYALLRRQYKAAEMVVIPGGTHGLATPSERMISLQGNVDWHAFWLQGKQRTEPMLWAETAETLNEQYRRWRQMADLKRADDARPDCALKTGGG